MRNIIQFVPALFLCLQLSYCLDFQSNKTVINEIPSVLSHEGEVSHYEVVYIRKTYFGAMVYCESIGGRLARIPDEERDIALVSWIYHADDEPAGRYWIDVNDIKEEGVWCRSDGVKQMYKGSWARMEPNNQNNEDCVELSEMADYKWNDRSCYFPNYFICEFTL
ncbi:collectin-11-like [Ptychodera flava]|uniref:collectin-11-like n=1 Tax=Ptychodera flava TaxID=63121 RepID=UPI003969DD6E